MRYFLSVCLVSIFFISCNQTKKETTQKKEEMVMYQPSEMAALMNAMYHENMTLKNKILKGDTIAENFPERYLNIHSAVLTDPDDRTASFEAFSKMYIQNMQAVYNTTQDSLPAKFNTAVNSCIACHKTTCTGPIPRIKKLLIK